MLYTVKEVATALRTNPAFVYTLIHKGILPAMKLGQYKVRKEALEEFIRISEGKDYSDLDNIQSFSS